MFIHPRCVKLIEDLETRNYKPGTQDPADGKEQGHMADAMDYIIHRIWPLHFDQERDDRDAPTVLVGEPAVLDPPGARMFNMFGL